MIKTKTDYETKIEVRFYLSLLHRLQANLGAVRTFPSEPLLSSSWLDDPLAQPYNSQRF